MFYSATFCCFFFRVSVEKIVFFHCSIHVSCANCTRPHSLSLSCMNCVCIFSSLSRLVSYFQASIRVNERMNKTNKWMESEFALIFLLVFVHIECTFFASLSRHERNANGSKTLFSSFLLSSAAQTGSSVLVLCAVFGEKGDAEEMLLFFVDDDDVQSMRLQYNFWIRSR